MKKLFFFSQIIILIFIILPVEGQLNLEDWKNHSYFDTPEGDGSGNNVTLNPSDTVYNNDKGKYTITVRSFDEQGMVMLDVSFMGRNDSVILQGEWYANRTKIEYTPPVELFDGMMIITTNKMVPPAGVYKCCPEIEININLIIPEISIGFYDDDSIEYRINDQIPVELNIINNGDAVFMDNEVYIDTDGLIFEDGKPYYQLSSLSGKNQKDFIGQSSNNIMMKLRFPYPLNKLNYTIHAYVRGKTKWIDYYYELEKEILLIPSVKIQKSATLESMLINRQEIEDIYYYLDENETNRWMPGGQVLVSIGVTNYQNYGIKGLRLTDSSGRNLNADNQSLEWTFDLKPFEIKEFNYRLKASYPGIFKLPPAHLTYSDLNRTWNQTSESPSTEVHGHCLQIQKKSFESVIPPGGNATIIVTIRNRGDMAAKVRIMDILPENSTFINGSMNYSGVLLPRTSTSISYNISTDASGQIHLPAPEIFINGRKNAGCIDPILSNIMFEEPLMPTVGKNVTIPVETTAEIRIQPQYRFLEGLIPVVMLILSVAVLIMLHRTNK